MGGACWRRRRLLCWAVRYSKALKMSVWICTETRAIESENLACSMSASQRRYSVAPLRRRCNPVALSLCHNAMLSSVLPSGITPCKNNLHNLTLIPSTPFSVAHPKNINFFHTPKKQTSPRSPSPSLSAPRHQYTPHSRSPASLPPASLRWPQRNQDMVYWDAARD